jgi:SRSO17 transposase
VLTKVCNGAARDQVTGRSKPDYRRYVLPEEGEASIGVARQYCGQLGKQENCQVAVSH